MKKMTIRVGDVVQIVGRYGVVQDIIGNNVRIVLSGEYGYGNWYTLDKIISHSALSKVRR